MYGCDLVLIAGIRVRRAVGRHALVSLTRLLTCGAPDNEASDLSIHDLPRLRCHKLLIVSMSCRGPVAITYFRDSAVHLLASLTSSRHTKGTQLQEDKHVGAGFKFLDESCRHSWHGLTGLVEEGAEGFDTGEFRAVEQRVQTLYNHFDI